MKLSSQSYPPPTSPRPFQSVNPKPVFPLHDPPDKLLQNPPSLPEEARQRRPESCPIAGYLVSTHIVPAAYPRQTPYIKPSDTILAHDANPSFKDKRLTVQKVADEFQAVRHKYHYEGPPPDPEEPYLLWNCINRYYPKANRPAGAKGVTLFLSHANGFSKEVRPSISQRS